MSPELARARPRSKRFGVDFEEERAWVTFYRRARHDATLAGEVLSQLDADPEMKRNHVALYLCCKESLRSQKSRQARNKRIGQFVRWLCHGLFVRPALAVQRALSQGGTLVVECLPETVRESTAPQAQRLPRQAALAQAHAASDEATAPVGALNGAAGLGVAASGPTRAKASDRAA